MKKFFYLLFVLPLMLVACEKGGDENPDQTTDVKYRLTLTSETTMEFSAEGGNGEISYAFTEVTRANYNDAGGSMDEVQTDRTDGVQTSPKHGISATCEAEWVTDITVDDTITFVVAANEGEAREAVIVVKYDTQKFEVAVKQAAKAGAAVVKGWAIVGSMTNDWDEFSALPMTETEDGYYAIYGFEVKTSDSFLFIENSDYANTRSSDGALAEADHGYLLYKTGSDIRVKEAGTYDIYLSKELDVYYLMSVGKNPDEGEEPELPGTATSWGLLGNFEGNNFAEDIEFVKRRNLYVAEDVVFAADGDVCFKVRKNKSKKPSMNYGARTKKVWNVGDEIQLYSEENKGTNNVPVAAERGVKYDIYFNAISAKVWVVPDGQEPDIEIVWDSVEGVLFSNTNYGLFMYSETHNLYFDFNSGEATLDGTIPEGVYYIDDKDKTGNNFNAIGEYTSFLIYGAKSDPVGGTLEIKHISGGYAITIDMVTMYHDEVKVHYEGPINEIPIMGRPITNPR